MDREELMEKAGEYAMHEHFDREIDCYDQMLEMDKEDARAWAGKAMAYFNTERLDDAIRCYEKALKLNPDDYDSWECMGRAISLNDPLDPVKKYDRVLECYDNAFRIKQEGFILQSKHHALLILNREEEALTCISNAIELEPDNAEFWTEKVELLGKMDRDEEAEECVDKAVQIEIHQEKPCYGRMLFYRKGYDESITSLKKEIEENPNDDYLHAFLGKVYSRLGKSDEAKKCFANAIKLNSKSIGIEFSKNML